MEGILGDIIKQTKIRTLKVTLMDIIHIGKRLASNKEIDNIFGPIRSEVENVSLEIYLEDVFKNHSNELAKPEDFINHSLYFEAKTFLNGLFIVEDKLSMSHGLETRVPFMDNDLVDFAMTCPIHLK